MQVRDDCLNITAVAPSVRALNEVVAIHQRAFQGAFLTRMGPRFLRHYYGSVIAHPGHIAVVARVGDRAVGFATGLSDPAEFYQKYSKVNSAAVAATLRSSVRHPSLVPDILRSVLRVRSAGPRWRGLSDVELSSLAVLPEFEGQTVGRRLVVAFAGACRAAGGQRVVVVTRDGTGNRRVLRFYEALGFERVGVESRRGHEMAVLALPV